MSNAEYIYDLKIEEVQVMIDDMVKLGIGKLKEPVPKSADFVRLDLLAKAKAELGIK